MEPNLTILVQQNELHVILCSSSSYLPSLELVQRENQYFLAEITGIPITKCDPFYYRVCALQSSSYMYNIDLYNTCTIVLFDL